MQDERWDRNAWGQVCKQTTNHRKYVCKGLHVSCAASLPGHELFLPLPTALPLPPAALPLCPHTLASLPLPTKRLSDAEDTVVPPTLPS